MSLQLQWSNADINACAEVLSNNFSRIDESTKLITQNFISNVKADKSKVRELYLNAVSVLLSFPEQLIYFVRELTMAHIALNYVVVPEFKHVVRFYSTLVRQARCTMR